MIIIPIISAFLCFTSAFCLFAQYMTPYIPDSILEISIIIIKILFLLVGVISGICSMLASILSLFLVLGHIIYLICVVYHGEKVLSKILPTKTKKILRKYDDIYNKLQLNYICIYIIVLSVLIFMLTILLTVSMVPYIQYYALLCLMLNIFSPIICVFALCLNIIWTCPIIIKRTITV